MKKPLCLMTLILLLVLGCSKSPTKPEEGHAEENTSKAQPHDGEGSNVLRIKAEMLRDLKITTSEAESRPADEGSMLLGELRVNENAYAEIGAPVSSRVLSLNAGVGDTVVAGQSLGLLQSTELGKAHSEVVTAKARLDLAKQVLDRKTRLAGERIVAQREVEEAAANVAQAEADLRASRSSMRALGAGMDESNDTSQFALRSPVAGTVIERTAVRGRMVDAEEVLFRVGDLSRLWLTVQAFERDAVRIKKGSNVRISFPAIPGTGFAGKVDLVGRQVDPSSRTLPIRVIVENRNGVLRPGMSATAWINPGGDTAVAIMVPAASVQRLGDDWVVFLPQEHAGEFEIRVIGRGRDLGGEIEVLSGLKVGEPIVVDGAFLLKAEAEKARGGGEEHKH